MIGQDARRILARGKTSRQWIRKSPDVSVLSDWRKSIGSIPGFGKTTLAEIAGEDRQRWSALKLNRVGYLQAWLRLDNSSGKKTAPKAPRKSTRAPRLL